MGNSKGVNQEIDKWDQQYRQHLKEHPERKKEFNNLSEIPLKPLYTPGDVSELDYMKKLGFPGEYPYTRGVYRTMHRGRLWTKRMIIGLEGPETFNKRFKQMCSLGQNAAAISFAGISARGYDTDQVDREYVGIYGVELDTLKDLEICLDGTTPLDEINLGCNDSAPHVTEAMAFALADKQGIPLRKLIGTSNQGDLLSHAIALKMFIRFPLEVHLRMLTDFVKFCDANVPKWHPLSIVGQHMTQAGASPVQGLAFTLASGICYVEEFIKAGLQVDDFAPRISAFFDCSISLFEEVAKFRAARRMWAKIMKERFGAKNPASWELRMHAQTSGYELTQQQPLNNIARVAIQALGAVLGGINSLHTDAYDEAIGTPREESARIALLTQHIIGEESGVADVIDPLGGSYYIESLTDEMEKKACEYIKTIDSKGGMLQAIKNGYIGQEIAKSAFQAELAVNRGEKTIVGLNRYVQKEEKEAIPEPPHPNPELVNRHIERTKRIKRERDQEQARKALDELKKTALSKEGNVFEATINAVKADLSRGEIIAALREAVGSDQAPPLLRETRGYENRR